MIRSNGRLPGRKRRCLVSEVSQGSWLRWPLAMPQTSFWDLRLQTDVVDGGLRSQWTEVYLFHGHLQARGTRRLDWVGCTSPVVPSHSSPLISIPPDWGIRVMMKKEPNDLFITTCTLVPMAVMLFFFIFSRVYIYIYVLLIDVFCCPPVRLARTAHPENI